MEFNAPLCAFVCRQNYTLKHPDIHAFNKVRHLTMSISWINKQVDKSQTHDLPLLVWNPNHPDQPFSSCTLHFLNKNFNFPKFLSTDLLPYFYFYCKSSVSHLISLTGLIWSLHFPNDGSIGLTPGDGRSQSFCQLVGPIYKYMYVKKSKAKQRGKIVSFSCDFGECSHYSQKLCREGPHIISTSELSKTVLSVRCKCAQPQD